jgi:predicted transcriptional regulator
MKTVTGKQSILTALDEELCEDATLEDAIDFLYYLHQIEEGIADEEAGRLITHEEVVHQIQQWLK